MRRSPLGTITPLLAVVALASGCARAGVTTQVRESGEATRVVRFSGDSGDAIRAAFVLPRGAGWSSTSAREGETTVITARRALGAAETSRGDLTVRGGEGTAGARPALVNEVTVRMPATGRWEYREVLRWNGPRARATAPEFALALGLRAALPRDRVEDATCRAVAHRAAGAYWRFLMGPSEPALYQALLHPEWSERRLKRLIATEIDAGLRDALGERLTSAERSAAVTRAVATVLPSLRHLPGGSNPGPGEEALPVPLAFSVRLPGRVTETNGAVDPLTGEVTWGLHAGAAAFEPVVLTATSVTPTATTQR